MHAEKDQDSYPENFFDANPASPPFETQQTPAEQPADHSGPEFASIWWVIVVVVSSFAALAMLSYQLHLNAGLQAEIAKFETQKSSWTEHDAERQRVRDKWSSLQSDVEHRVDQTRDRLAANDGKLKAVSKQLAESISELKNEESMIEQKRAKLKSIETDFELARTSLQSSELKSQSAKDKLQLLDSAVVSRQAELDQLMTDMEQYDAEKLAKLKEAYEKRLEDGRTVKRKTVKEESDLAKTRATLVAAKESLKNAEESLKKLKGESMEVQATIDGNQEALAQTIKDLVKIKFQARNDLEDIQSQIKNGQNTVAEAAAAALRLKDAEGQLEELNDKLGLVQSKNETKKEILSKSIVNLENIQAQIKAGEKTIAEAEVAAIRLKAAIRDEKDAQKKHNDLKIQAAQIAGEIRQKTADNLKLTEELAAKTQERESLKLEVERLQKEVDKLN